MVTDWLKRLFTFKPAPATLPVQPGLYHVMQETEGTFTRLHLRVENDGSGMLVANAMAAARLSPSGVVIAKGLMEGWPQDRILQTLKASFSGATEATMRADIETVSALIEQIKTPGDTYPVFNLEDVAISPYGAQLIAPLEASLPLAEPEIVAPLLDRLWEIGIPHVTFLAPDGFQTDSLIRAVERAEDLGMIAGVRSRASNLNDEGLLADLRQAGVDHITFLYAANNPEMHDAICGSGDYAAAQAVLAWLEENQISAIAEIPLVQTTLDVLHETVDTLIEEGADNFVFVAFATTDPAVASTDGVFHSEGMAQVAATVEDIANMAQARFIWDPPVERDPVTPLAEQVRSGPRCSGDVAVRVEPNGTIIPPRGPYASAGNVLTDSWESIWGDDVFRTYRERVTAPTRCEVCPGLAICAADCPRDRNGWAQVA